MTPHAPHGPYMRRSRDESVRSSRATLSRRPYFVSDRGPEAREFENELDGRLSFRFDLNLLLLPSSQSQNRNCSHSRVLVHFRHARNRTSGICGSLCTHRAILLDLPWMPMQG